jgi:hypothetical protein
LQFYGEASATKSQNILELANKFNNNFLQKEETTENNPIAVETNYGKVSPENGHNSVRVSAGYGKQNSQEYIDLRFRPAFHDLMDSVQGYVPGAAINSFEAKFKWFIDSDNGSGSNSLEPNSSESNNSRGKLRLESLTILNITSLNPVRRWHQPLSWLIDLRVDTMQLSETNSVRNFIGRGGFGLSFQRKQFFPFLMLLGEGNLSSHYKKGYSILLSLQAGLQLNFKSNRLMLSFQTDKAVSGFDLDRVENQLQWQYDFQVNHAIRLRYRRSEYDFFDDEDWSLSYNYYF